MKPSYTDVKTMHTDIGYHMRISGRRRHLLRSQSTEDALANVLVRQLVRLHDPPAAGSPCTAQETTARPYKHFYTLDCAKCSSAALRVPKNEEPLQRS